MALPIIARLESIVRMDRKLNFCKQTEYAVAIKNVLILCHPHNHSDVLLNTRLINEFKKMRLKTIFQKCFYRR